MKSLWIRVALLLAIVALPMAPLAAQEVKSLDWTAFVVDARLDSTGTLLVREKQTVLFNGDWNGGERRFDVRDGQSFVFRRMYRVDSATGAEIPMRAGSLDDVDGYKMTGGRTLRWRSRLANDAPFLNAKITYVLEYEYADILKAKGETYRLDHEFGFRDRSGTIANFDLTLKVDRAWRTPAGFTGVFHEDALAPGIGYVVDIPLTYVAAGQPSAVRRSPPLTQRAALAAALVLILVGLTVRFVRDEIAVGRFEPLPPLDSIDQAWLERHVLSLRPELVGYAWDEEVGAPEVSATLARMVNEKKLASRVEESGGRFTKKHVLHLEMLMPRQTFQGYERALVDALFSSGATTTSTDTIRARYASTGFDPASHIRAPLTEQFTALFGTKNAAVAPPPRWKVTLALVVVGIALVALSIVVRRADGQATLLSIAVVGVPMFFLALLQAYLWRRRVIRPAPHLLRVLGPIALLLGVFCWGLLTGFGTLGMLALTGMAVLLVAATRSALNCARARATRERMLRRKELAVAREYCRIELRKPAPALTDAWYPYLLAFGLGRHVEKWFSAFGAPSTPRRSSGVGTTASSSSIDGGSSGGSSSSGGTFGGFGGGGGFSGAGATVAFGSALGAMSSGVAAPSSSSSSGGGSSSSGGSSGGGGGGGW